jgi:hypothetical protein
VASPRRLVRCGWIPASVIWQMVRPDHAIR